ncbi:radical SAM protein [Dongia deserti]|uniref:radical SAM protein n=1 Tax=Dongia deserti TaxID=2268030 RepID=UPI000E656768|nr:radical SAM protein [Dongia deserti]
MKHDIEADWLLFTTCNYRCDYCFLDEMFLGQKVQVLASPAEWRAAFDRTGLTWLLHITGGEPTHYPDFARLTALLAERHVLSLNSNLTGPTVLDFAERVDPARVSFINAGLHPAERARRNGHDLFVRHAAALLERGFPLMVTVVATPEVLHRFDAIVDSLKPVGLVPFPKLMQGEQAGRRYPDSYTAEERALFRRHSLAAERANPRLFGGTRERPSIDPTLGRAHLERNPDYRGRLCSAGKEFVAIDPAGEVVRCGGGATMGNVLAGTLHLKSKARPCDRSHCFYFCEKFTARAERQWARRHPLAAIARRVKGAAGAA